jgi:hypothetical protein
VHTNRRLGRGQDGIEVLIVAPYSQPYIECECVRRQDSVEVLILTPYSKSYEHCSIIKVSRRVRISRVERIR